MDDDFNTADAISAIFDLVRVINAGKGENPSGELAAVLYDRLKTLCDVLGLIVDAEDELGDEEIERLIVERTEARKNKNYARADEIRKELLDRGIVLEDTRQGVVWKRA